MAADQRARYVVAKIVSPSLRQDAREDRAVEPERLGTID
jgi:hypothetical protein